MNKQTITSVILVALIATISCSKEKNAANPDFLPGEFSVSESTKVVFSKGNLQYQASTDTWRFAEHQYDYVGNASGNNTELGRDVQPGWIDLFGWGTTGKNQYGQPPYSIDEDASKYKTIETAASDEMLTRENDGDWGVCMGEGWRTLSNNEWSYLTKIREGADEKIGYATVAGVRGIIILPDKFNDPMKNNGDGAFKPKSEREWSENIYTETDWKAMEKAGAVFMPATGNRHGCTVSNVGNECIYWSSKANYSNYVYYINFLASSPFAVDYATREYGFPVRLVR